MKDLIKLIQKNKILSWAIALGIGVLFRYLYGLAKDGIWKNQKLDYITDLINSFSELQITIFSILFNGFVDLSSSLVPALLCGMILIYIFQEKAFLFTFGSVAMFMVLSSRLWRFWRAPDLAGQITTLMGPIMSILTLILTVWALLNIRKRITLPSTQTRI